jgi:hypothetical protein
LTVISRLQQIIIQQSQNTAYYTHDATTNIVQCSYQSFFNLLEQYPQEMSEYLSGSSHKHFGFQSMLFQEMLTLLEQKLPYQIRKNKQVYTINNLLDANLSLFDGISIFEGMADHKLIVKNQTSEFYVGSRKATICKPYFIGRLLEARHRQDNSDLRPFVSSYSFSQVQFRNIQPGTIVKITHLRTAPHYQMGGMSYLNRARQQIIKQLKGSYGNF